MGNVDAHQGDRAEEVGISLAPHTEPRQARHRGVRPRLFWPTAQHIPGDTRTPPAPGVVHIGPEDV